MWHTVVFIVQKFFVFFYKNASMAAIEKLYWAQWHILKM